MALKINQSFKIYILMILIPFFLVTFLAIRFYTHYEYTEDVMNISHNFPVMSNNTAISEVNDYLKPAGVTKITAEVLQNIKKIDLTSPQLNNDLHSMLDTYPQLSSIYVVDDNGNLLNLIHINDSAQNLSFIPHATSNATFVTEMVNRKKNIITWSYFDNNGTLISSAKSQNNTIDTRNNTWYQGAISNQGYWMGMYNSFNNNPGISVSYPIIQNGKIRGVVGVDFNATNIRDFLAQLQQSLNSTLFIINDQGKPLTANAPDNHENSNALIDAAITNQTLNKQYPSAFTVNGTSYIMDMVDFPTDYNAKWRIGTIIPLDALIGKVNHTNKIILYFALSMLSMAILFILLAAWRLSKPLGQIATEAQKLKHLDFDKITWPNSHITEVNSLVSALNSTKNTLAVLTQYLPRHLVRKLIKNNLIGNITADKRNLTFLASNINNLDHILERVSDPHLFAQDYSRCLNLMSYSILKNHGTIDQNMNDAMISFWGAPEINKNHIIHAAVAALTCRNHMHALNKEARELNKPNYNTYFGLHTGPAIVGNISSLDKINYTAMGDNVSFTAQLPKINKIYNTEIIASQAMYNEAKEICLFRPIDFVKIPNRDRLVLVYELVAALTEQAPQELQASTQEIKLCEMTKQAFKAFHEENWGTAMRLYAELQQAFPNDRIAPVFIERCNNRK